MTTADSRTLYCRLGGYDAVAALCDELLPRLTGDPRLGRFWAHRGADGIRREKQLLINFLCASAGAPMYYTGRDMTVTHRGMGITAEDWDRFIGHLRACLDDCHVAHDEQCDVLAFIESTRSEICE